MRTNTSFARKWLSAYVCEFCARRKLCVRCTDFERKATYAYEVRLLRVKRLIFKVFLDCVNGGNDGKWYPASRLQWTSMESYPVLHVAMTINGVLDFCDRPNSLARRIYNILFFLCDDLDSRLSRPSWRMRSSFFSLRRSWLLIGPSFSSCLEASAMIFLQHWSVRFKSRPSPDDDYLLNPV